MNFFFNDTATTEIYTLSLHDALPISLLMALLSSTVKSVIAPGKLLMKLGWSDTEKGDRKSTRLNSSHQIISYAVFCLKKKNIHSQHQYAPHSGRSIGRSHHSLRKQSS